MASAQNASYGSTLSPPRLQQVRESVHQYLESTTMETDSLWQLLGNEVCAQQKVDATIPGQMEKVYKSLRDNKLLWSKGEKVARADQVSLFAEGSSVIACVGVLVASRFPRQGYVAPLASTKLSQWGALCSPPCPFSKQDAWLVHPLPP